MAENVCKAYKDYFGGFRIFNSADLSDTVLFYGCYMELECADKLCVYLRRRGYGISSVCDTGGGRLLYGGVYGINDCVCIDVIFLTFETSVMFQTYSIFIFGPNQTVCLSKNGKDL